MNRVDTTAILEEIAYYDQREINADVISHWHEHIGHLTKAVASEAVAIHQKTSSERITPEHVNAIAAQIVERKPTQRPMRRAVMTAYTVTGAINDPCPNCEAQPGETCTNKATGQEAHAPCLARLIGKTIAA